MSNVDPELAHLYLLLSMLPGPEKERFWSEVAEINKTSPDYVYEKMSSLAFYLDSPVPVNGPGSNIGYFCNYAYMFFGGGRPDLWDLVSLELFGIGNDRGGGMGKVFVDDLLSTLWALRVRYGRETDMAKLRKWSNAHLRHPAG